MRALWAAVVLQAQDDLDQHPYDSVIWSQAYAFFTAAGEWGASRQSIADCLDLHVDDLTRLGRATCAARVARDGGPPAPEPPVMRTARPSDDIRSAAPPEAPDDAAPVRAHKPRSKKEARDRNWWITSFLQQQVS